MDQLPCVTVVIPVYNREAYIAHAIESVLNQSCRRWKLLIIDDASSDRTAAVIRPYLADSRIEYKYLSENRGVGNALQTAISFIDTPYFVVLDSDDWMDSSTLEILVNEMRKQPESTSLIYGNTVVWEESGQQLIQSKVMKARPFSDKYEFILYRNMVYPRFFRTSAVQAVGGFGLDLPHGGRYGEDRYLLLKLIGVSNFHWVDKDLYHLRRHKDNTANKKNVKKFADARRYMVNTLLKQWGYEYEPVFTTIGGWLNVKELISKDGQKRKVLEADKAAGNELPYVSVIIPTYNRAHLIRKAIDTVLAQTFENYELIIVDDASTDRTERVVKNYKDLRIRYVKHKQNQGVAAALKTGIKKSRGQYVAFLDSDDEWMPEKLQKQVKLIESLPNKENSVIYTKLIRDRGTEQALRPKRAKLDDEPLADYFFIHWGLMQNSTLMIPHALLTRLLPLPNPERHQDWDMCLQLEKLGTEFHYLDEILAIWHDDQRKDRLSIQLMPEYNLQWIEGYRNQISEKAYNSFIATLVTPYLDSKSTDQAKKKKKKKKD